MKTTTKKFILFGTIFAVLVVSVVALQVLLVANVTPGSSCTETDNWAGSLKSQYGVPGSMSGNFTVGNQTFSGPFYDTCLSNQTGNGTLVEMVCGGSINPSYNNLAAALLVNCASDINATATGNCVQTPSGGMCT